MLRFLILPTASLMVATSAHAWEAVVSHCEPTREKLVAQHLQCDQAEPITAPCGKIHEVVFDAGAIAVFQVDWANGAQARIKIDAHGDQYCIDAQQYLGKRDLADVAQQ